MWGPCGGHAGMGGQELAGGVVWHGRSVALDCLRRIGPRAVASQAAGAWPGVSGGGFPHVEDVM